MTALTIATLSESAAASKLPTRKQQMASNLATVTPKVRKIGRGRKAPSPNSILDRRVLLQTLEERGITVKAMHIDGFYQALHRQNYPDLPEFVEQFLRNEQAARTKNNNTGTKSLIENDENSELPTLAPLKNAVSQKKNRNRGQLPRALLDFLKDPNNGLVTVTSKIALQLTSADSTTTKLAVQLHDGQLVESVLMRYVTHGGSRASLCVSSQCGCAMGCTFCATGTMGLSGNLTTGEILEQIVHADRILASDWGERKSKEEVNGRQLQLDLVRNVVFMGMGEPLDNYSNVVEACRSLLDRRRWNLANGRVTVSTVGLTSQIRKLTRELPDVSLALSLHAPNQAMRNAIVPTAKRYPIEDLIQALDEHMMAYLKDRRKRLLESNKALDKTEYTADERIQESSRRRAMIEYVMLEGPTSSLEAAHELGKLCENRRLVVNLIPYNATDVKDKLQCPPREHMKEFQRIVMSYGSFCTIR
jgi:sorting nexin-8